eukprot:4280049-Alexandrium_andersonii.AAC.1
MRQLGARKVTWESWTLMLRHMPSSTGGGCARRLKECGRRASGQACMSQALPAVSYTHLTLPTICSV